MLIRCWGARGSIPVSGPQYLQYGGDTTCIEVRSRNDDIIIIDAGSGIRQLGTRLLQEKRHTYTFLFTHAHWDHILGFPFFKPIYHEKSSILVHGCPLEQGNMQTLLSKTMSAPYFPVPYEMLKANIQYTQTCSLTQEIGGITVETIALSHPNMGVGFRLTEDGKSFVFLTDNELSHPHRGGKSFEEYAEFAKDADLLIHDAEYTPQEYELTKGWGHTVYEDAARLAFSAKVKNYGLFHHNQDRSDEGVNAMVAHTRELATQSSVNISCFGCYQGMEFQL